MKIKVPVLSNFQHNDIIGYLEVKESWLPYGDDWHFSIGYRVLEVDADGAHSKIELLCVSPQYDAHTNNKSLP